MHSLTYQTRGITYIHTQNHSTFYVAGGGIGAGIAQHLASLGVSVVLAGRTESKLQAVYEQIVKAGGSAAITVGDAASPEGNKKYVDDTLSKFGQLNIAVNNAGVYRGGKIVDVTPDAVNDVLGTNINSIIYGMKYQFPAIGKYSTAEDKGVVINISSVVSTYVRKTFSTGNSVYQASKAAVDMLTRIGALEGAEYNTRVVAINPAFVHSQMSHGGFGGREKVDEFQAKISLTDKAGEAQDVADLVTYLVTAPYVNASLYYLDGGALSV